MGLIWKKTVVHSSLSDTDYFLELKIALDLRRRDRACYVFIVVVVTEIMKDISCVGTKLFSVGKRDLKNFGERK